MEHTTHGDELYLLSSHRRRAQQKVSSQDWDLLTLFAVSRPSIASIYRYISSSWELSNKRYISSSLSIAEWLLSDVHHILPGRWKEQYSRQLGLYMHKKHGRFNPILWKFWAPFLCLTVQSAFGWSLKHANGFAEVSRYVLGAVSDHFCKWRGHGEYIIVGWTLGFINCHNHPDWLIV